MMSSTFSEVVRAAGRLGEEVRYGDEPRFELYAFSGSICSEKVRSTLLALEYAFVERRLDFFLAQTYHPDYVRLRSLASQEKVMDAESIEWDGSTSAHTHGVDPLVVPTLVDLDRNVVVVDSRRIVDYLDPENRLKTREMKEQLDIVDTFPHLSILYGGFEVDRRPFHLRLMLTPKQHGARMLAAQMRYREKADESLRKKYDAKIAKTKTCFAKCEDDREKTASARAARIALIRLDADIPSFPAGKTLNAADIAWFVTLYRLQLLGNLPVLAQDLANVLPYFHSLFRHDALIRGVVAVDGQVPSHHVLPLIHRHAGFAVAAKNLLFLFLATADALLRTLLSSKKMKFTSLLLLVVSAAVTFLTL